MRGKETTGEETLSSHCLIWLHRCWSFLLLEWYSITSFDFIFLIDCDHVWSSLTGNYYWLILTLTLTLFLLYLTGCEFSIIVKDPYSFEINTDTTTGNLTWSDWLFCSSLLLWFLFYFNLFYCVCWHRLFSYCCKCLIATASCTYLLIVACCILCI